ncbi:hypothetical protein [Vibrio aestuarianus]|uniref:Uncharacterized protein n=1 Tax=Vibrio aestuarianus TaxID=28171 RepID=A0A9X4IZV3_9VIBR|nr:hypothetical protein [Vibrio aestuarianus]MDE1236214.1 hypothetical protein [Vibrio aestuarianus]MDE1247112.1 hypothetical protein [Vibrio aestuarianus]MDE1346306.1 hypothetical protein [Vibrio aestuarianus]MDE1351747.1 hypothetical protein [Vibrio aestuarianus]NGZ64174.1 hypothetical protein [Vibrio aestuarianus subsp. cardii]
MADATLILGNNGGITFPCSNEDRIQKAEEFIVRNHLPVGRTLLQKERDPLALVEQLLVAHLETEKLKAEETARLVQKKSKAIAEINRLWGLVMKDNIPHTDPNDNGKETPLGDSPEANRHLTEIDRIIREDLGENSGVMKITGKDLAESLVMMVSYTDLQTFNATMTAYCDTIQVDLDSLNQEFKNNMTQITSVQEEVRSVRTAVVSMAQG